MVESENSDRARSSNTSKSVYCETAVASELSGWKVFAIWLSVSLGVLCTFLDEGIISTAIPRITDQFHSLSDVGWYGSAYQMTLCAFQLVFGRLYSQFEIRTIFLGSLAIFELGSLVCATSHSSVAFIIGRAVAGLGASGLQSGSLILISATLPSNKLPMYIGAIGAIYGVAAVAGPVVGGLITNSHLTWRWCFYVNLPISVLPVIGTILLVKTRREVNPENKPWLHKVLEMDYIGMLVLLPSIVSLILALQLGSAVYSWSDRRPIACFILSGVLLIAFMIQQGRLGENALVPLRILRLRPVVFGCIFAFCLDSAFFVLVYYLPLWFQAIQGVSAEASGVRYLAFCIAFIFAIFLSGWGVTKLGYFQPFMLAGTVLVSVGAGLLSTLDISSGSNRWIPYQIIAGLGVGASTQQPAVAVQSLLSQNDVAFGVGIVMFFQCLGPAIFITVGQAAFTTVLTDGIERKLPQIDPQLVKDSGATQLRTLVDDGQIPTLLGIYNRAITRTFLIAAVIAAASVIGVLGIGLKRIPAETPGTSTKESQQGTINDEKMTS